MELPAGIAMIVALVLTIGVKYVTTVRAIRLREQVFDAESDVRSVRGKLKTAQNEKGIAEREVKTLTRQRDTLEKKLKLYTEEISGLRK